MFGWGLQCMGSEMNTQEKAQTLGIVSIEREKESRDARSDNF